MPPDRPIRHGVVRGVDRRTAPPTDGTYRRGKGTLIGDPSSEISDIKLDRAKERLADSNNTVVLITKIKGVPGVSYLTSVVRDRDFPALGGSRRSEFSVIKANLDNARAEKPDYVEKILGGRTIPDDEAAAGVLEAWQLGDQMWQKYANLHRYLRIMIERQSPLLPPEILAEPERWLEAARFFGGLKSVTVVNDMAAFEAMTPEQHDLLLKQQADHMEELNTMTVGSYTAPDMKVTAEDISTIRNKFKSPYTAGYAEADGGSGNPSPVTALGVNHTTRATVKFLGIPEDEVSFAIQGAGEVGNPLAHLQRSDHPQAPIYVADTDPDKLTTVIRQVRATQVPLNQIHTAGKIYNPAAISGIVNRTTLPEMIAAGVRGVVPVANAIFEAGRDEELAQQAHDGGVVITPAAHTNNGGIANILREFVRGPGGELPPRRVIEDMMRIMEPMTTELLEQARAENVPPQTIFDRNALEEYALVADAKGLLN